MNCTAREAAGERGEQRALGSSEACLGSPHFLRPLTASLAATASRAASDFAFSVALSTSAAAFAFALSTSAAAFAFALSNSAAAFPFALSAVSAAPEMTSALVSSAAEHRPPMASNLQLALRRIAGPPCSFGQGAQSLEPKL